MKKIKSKSDKRLIVECIVNNKPANFLIDTGASVGLIDYDQRRDYDLAVGRSYNGTLVGAGGEIKKIKHCDTFVELVDKKIPQFLLADISHVVESIERETDITILGIISLSQMKICGINIDANDNEIIIE